MDERTVYAISGTTPAKDYENVSASDTVDFIRLARAVRFDTGGTVVLVRKNGLTATITVLDGETFPGNVRRINATGTTASGFLAYWS